MYQVSNSKKYYSNFTILLIFLENFLIFLYEEIIKTISEIDNKIWDDDENIIDMVISQTYNLDIALNINIESYFLI